MNTEKFVTKEELEGKLDEVDPQKDINALHRKNNELEQKLDLLSFAVVTLIHRHSGSLEFYGSKGAVRRIWTTGSSRMGKDDRRYLKGLIDKHGYEELIKEFLTISYPDGN